MLGWSKGTEIVIWGTGKVAKKMFFRYRYEFPIVAFIDNEVKDQELYGIPVLSPNATDLRCRKVLIASTYWEEIASQLKEHSMVFGKDFLPYWCFEYDNINLLDLGRIERNENLINAIDYLRQGKSIAIIHGNCQTEFIQKGLECYKEFAEQFIFLQIPRIHLCNKNDIDVILNDQVWKKCKLFITQPVKADNAYDSRLGSEHLISLLSEETKILFIPNLYFDIYFPQAIRQKNNVLADIVGGRGLFPYGDSFIEQEYSCKFTLREMVEHLVEQVPMELDFSYTKKKFLEIETRERGCHIKMSDFIQFNYTKKRLFYTRNHPSREVLLELLRRIICELGIYRDTDLSLAYQKIYTKDLDFIDEVIYPWVKKQLNLEFECEYYMNSMLTEKKITISEYIEQYISVCLL